MLSSWGNVIKYCRTVMASPTRSSSDLFLDKRNQLIADELQQVAP